jgi:hypothetical protein
LNSLKKKILCSQVKSVFNLHSFNILYIWNIDDEWKFCQDKILFYQPVNVILISVVKTTLRKHILVFVIFVFVNYAKDMSFKWLTIYHSQQIIKLKGKKNLKTKWSLGSISHNKITKELQTRFYWVCSWGIMNTATSLTPPSTGLSGT